MTHLLFESSRRGQPRMSDGILALLAVLAATVVALRAWRWTDLRADRVACRRLLMHQPASPTTFDTSMISSLPVAARRFFEFAIEPGASLYTAAEITMEGRFSLGDRDHPRYMPMRATQVLAAPHGFVWKVRAGDKIWFTGSDAAENGASWSRFWLLGILPVARAGDNPDHLRAAFGRYVAEAVFWTPAALLPGENVRWDAIDDASARVIMTHRGLEQAVDLTIDAEGRPVKVTFQRWSDANPEKRFRLQPFGGYLSDYRTFDGYRLPTRVEAGNFFETDDYFAFFKANVTAVRFPRAPGNND